MADQLPDLEGGAGRRVEATPVLIVGENGVPTGGTSDSTLTTVASSASSVTLLAENANRIGATIRNTDANTLYVDLSGGTASTASHSVAVETGGYFEVPYGYRGAVTGIWAADGGGEALITEFG